MVPRPPFSQHRRAPTGRLSICRQAGPSVSRPVRTEPPSLAQRARSGRPSALRPVRPLSVDARRRGALARRNVRGRTRSSRRCLDLGRIILGAGEGRRQHAQDQQCDGTENRPPRRIDGRWLSFRADASNGRPWACSSPRNERNFTTRMFHRLRDSSTLYMNEGPACSNSTRSSCDPLRARLLDHTAA